VNDDDDDDINNNSTITCRCSGMYICMCRLYIYIYIVTYSGSIFTMELYYTTEVNTLQLNTASNSSNTRTRPTCTVPEHSLLYNSSNRTSYGNLPTLTPILAVRKLPNTSRDNPSSGYRSTCPPQLHLGL
jgi:hypothetical protein